MTPSVGELCVVVVLGERDQERDQRIAIACRDGHVLELRRRIAHETLARESGDGDVLIDDRVEIECGAVVEVRSGVGTVAQHRSLELRHGGGETLIDVAVHGADKALQSTLRVGHVRVEVDVPEDEIGVVRIGANASRRKVSVAFGWLALAADTH